MKIFLDTATIDTEVIKEHFKTGLIDGVTTNPSLIMKSGRNNPEDVYQELKDLGVKDISMEVMGNFVEMYTEASRLSQKFGDGHHHQGSHDQGWFGRLSSTHTG